MIMEIINLAAFPTTSVPKIRHPLSVCLFVCLSVYLFVVIVEGSIESEF